MTKLTIARIAELAGVSTGTVSRALNGRPGISTETRDKVLSIVRLTGFVPDAGARRLARKTSHLIGIAPFSEHTPHNPYFALLLDAVQERLYRSGFVARVLDPDSAQARSCAGFIVPGLYLDDPRVGRMQRLNLPLAVVGQESDQVAWVDIDNAAGQRLALELLIGLGHTRIAYLTGLPVGQTTEARGGAYHRALSSAGLTPDPALLLEADFSELGAYRAVRRFLESSARLPFTALAAASDLMANGAMKALADLGYRVPQDVSVTGFDDLPLAQHLQPALTTVAQPIREIGSTVAELLLEQLQGMPIRQVVLPTVLVTRASTSTRSAASNALTLPARV
jgi:LacI family transcriptional regulator